MSYIYDQITPDMKPLKVAVVHPTDAVSLRGAFEAAAAKLIVPVLVGPKKEIEKAAAEAHIDISKFEIVSTQNDQESAQTAARLAGTGAVEGLMKGKLHSDVFIRAILTKENNLRGEGRMNGVMRDEDPAYHKPLYIVDPSMNIAPDVDVKKAMLQNTIDLFRKIEGHDPKVAILAATEEEVANQPATGDAVKLRQMAERGEITDAKVAGPFAMDIAISKEAAELKGIFNKAAPGYNKVAAEVAGDADILVFPNLESANIFFKSRIYMSHAEMGGLLIGAKVPVILTSRSASAEERKASAALALLSVRKAAPAA